jgi:RNA polymerase sigma factor (sigma-70 family)
VGAKAQIRSFFHVNLGKRSLKSFQGFLCSVLLPGGALGINETKMTDSQKLLAEYAACGSESAFRELVARYVNLVFSTALRLVGGDRQLAQDVTQTVFADLAQKARGISKDVMLGGWLHRRTFNVATTMIRGERRRQVRERQALEMNAFENHPELDFSRVAPVLDGAVNELDEPDRTAILLRFFEQQEFRRIGETIGSSEDAARMRVSRALEKLELMLKRRGITSTAIALSGVLSAHAVQSAPAGLAATIAGAALAGAPVSTSTAIAVPKTVVMTTIQKSIVAAALAAAVGTGIYEARQVSHFRQQNQTLQQGQIPLTEQVQQLEREREDMTNRLATLQAENTRLQSNQSTRELLRLRGETGLLRQQVEAARNETNRVSPEDQLIVQQTHVVDAMTAVLQAIKGYATNHNGQYPEDLNQLAASGELGASNFAGNLGLNDFELKKPSAGPNGETFILGLRVPLQKPGGGALIVQGGISDTGVPHTSIWNVAQ